MINSSLRGAAALRSLQAARRGNPQVVDFKHWIASLRSQ